MSAKRAEHDDLPVRIDTRRDCKRPRSSRSHGSATAVQLLAACPLGRDLHLVPPTGHRRVPATVAPKAMCLSVVRGATLTVFQKLAQRYAPALPGSYAYFQRTSQYPQAPVLLPTGRHVRSLALQASTPELTCIPDTFILESFSNMALDIRKEHSCFSEAFLFCSARQASGRSGRDQGFVRHTQATSLGLHTPLDMQANTPIIDTTHSDARHTLRTCRTYCQH
ncbi:hypothetical protein FA95DRAFT_939109 [Auriscalpium vulgare]|uniref:Uncharacterized protein n=1 Tax=Auriscalpium vulgare TaxID=40419 RepID=A0ACB8SAI7_9AGAM|nr:hypothetical protein FA95DRAFT_939109 [Auriscalpium vulgare]